MSEISSQLLLGFIQGVAEWLPISSSGHLAAASIIFQIHQTLAYDVFLHVASLVVIFFYFRKQVIRLTKAVAKPEMKHERKLIGYILVTSVATILFALLLTPVVQYVRLSPAGLAVAFAVTSLVVGYTALRGGNRDLTLKDAILLGIAQGFAVIPGISRSGMMIGTGLILGIEKKQAFEYAFLAVIPIIIAAFASVINKFSFEPIFLIGFSFTILVSLASLWILERIVTSRRFHYFALYTIVVAVFLFTVI